MSCGFLNPVFCHLKRIPSNNMALRSSHGRSANSRNSTSPWGIHVWKFSNEKTRVKDWQIFPKLWTHINQYKLWRSRCVFFGRKIAVVPKTWDTVDFTTSSRLIEKYFIPWLSDSFFASTSGGPTFQPSFNCFKLRCSSVLVLVQITQDVCKPIFDTFPALTITQETRDVPHTWWKRWGKVWVGWVYKMEKKQLRDAPQMITTKLYIQCF